MPRIDIDDDVFAALARRVQGFGETPNDVLRRLVLGGAPSSRRGAGGAGALARLLAAGLIAPGDGLVHSQIRKGRTFHATVTADGYVETEHGRYREPSPALRDLVGSQIDGWANWMHTRSGKRLRDLRGLLPDASRSP